MNESLIKAYEMCALGQARWVGPDQESGDSVEAFQATMRAAEKMQQDGKLIIIDVHQESQTSFRYTDRLKFERIS